MPLTGPKVLFLPAYSPHLNPISKMWSKIKARSAGAPLVAIDFFEALYRSAVAFSRVPFILKSSTTNFHAP